VNNAARANSLGVWAEIEACLRTLTGTHADDPGSAERASDAQAFVARSYALGRDIFLSLSAERVRRSTFPAPYPTARDYPGLGGVRASQGGGPQSDPRRALEKRHLPGVTWQC
jgi:hypothetical protein